MDLRASFLWALLVSSCTAPAGDGPAGPAAPPTSMIPEGSRLVGVFAADAGHALVLTRESSMMPESAAQALSKVDREGKVVWTAAVPLLDPEATPTFSGGHATLRATMGSSTSGVRVELATGAVAGLPDAGVDRGQAAIEAQTDGDRVFELYARLDRAPDEAIPATVVARGADGAPLWRTPIEAYAPGTPLRAVGELVFAPDRSGLLALRRADGTRAGVVARADATCVAAGRLWMLQNNRLVSVPGTGATPAAQDHAGVTGLAEGEGGSLLGCGDVGEDLVVVFAVKGRDAVRVLVLAPMDLATRWSVDLADAGSPASTVMSMPGQIVLISGADLHAVDLAGRKQLWTARAVHAALLEDGEDVVVVQETRGPREVDRTRVVRVDQGTGEVAAAIDVEAERVEDDLEPRFAGFGGPPTADGARLREGTLWLYSRPSPLATTQAMPLAAFDARTLAASGRASPGIRTRDVTEEVRALLVRP